MGMVLALRKVSSKELASLTQSPEDVVWFLTGEHYEATPNFFESLASAFRLKKRQELKTQKKEWAEPRESDEIDLDKAWQGIHFLLTGTADAGVAPDSYLLTGKTIGDVEVGYGPAMYLTVEDVCEFDSYLQHLDIEFLKENYDAEKMKSLNIYPDIFVPIEEDSKPFEYLVEYFISLKNFINILAKENSALLLYLT